MQQSQRTIANKAIWLSLWLLCGYFVNNGVKTYRYSTEYSEEKSDVAIVLGAATNAGQLSPVFRERINQSLYLYHQKRIKLIILTGGYGDGQSSADSEVARKYLRAQGVPDSDIAIEQTSRYTIENLMEAKHIMDSLGMKSALIVTDPLHSRRAMELAENLAIPCKPSPTPTTMYRTFWTKAKLLVYETFYYSLGEIAGKH